MELERIEKASVCWALGNISSANTRNSWSNGNEYSVRQRTLRCVIVNGSSIILIVVVVSVVVLVVVVVMVDRPTPKATTTCVSGVSVCLLVLLM